MSKIKFDAILKSDDENLHIIGTGIRYGNVISYKENDTKIKLYIYSNKVEMERITDEYEVKLSFKLEDKEMSTYKLKGYDVFLLDVDTKSLYISDNCIKVNYILEDKNFSYVLTMEDL